MANDLFGRAMRLSAYIGEIDTYEDKPLYVALADQARTAGCSGVTVLRGILGFGATSRMHARHDLRMSSDLPLVVQVIDLEHKIVALAEVFSAMVSDGLITLEEIDVVMYRGGVTGGPE